MNKILVIIAGLFMVFSFDDNRNNKTNQIWDAQIANLQGKSFIEKGITGKGIRIAVLDGGFPGVQSHPAFRALIANNRIKATWNFVKNKEDVYSGVSHGTEVLACIAGVLDGRNMGLATDAEFLLALTEQAGEPLSEEINWAKAVDWAIENGANIIQSSLGYTYQRYFPEDLDGNHSIAARAAARAAARGILVVNCNGNEGTTKWNTLVTPADADSILSVGAIDPATGLTASFSSVGPTSDSRLKPNVTAPGIVVVPYGKNGTRIVEGTSFSSPLVAGFAACVWQLYPTLNAQEIIGLIQKSGNLYPFYDYSHGFGIPKATRILRTGDEPTGQAIGIVEGNGSLTIDLPSRGEKGNEPFPENYLYYHFSKPSGRLIRYGVYRVNDLIRIDISSDGISPGDIFRCSYKSITAEWTLNQ